MEEREALKRQIELLQNLINNHKSVHGDVPSGGSQRNPSASAACSWQHQGHKPVFSHSLPLHPQPSMSSAAGQWRKKYSLSNKTARADRKDSVTATQSSKSHSAGFSLHSTTSVPTSQTLTTVKSDKSNSPLLLKAEVVTSQVQRKGVSNCVVLNVTQTKPKLTTTAKLTSPVRRTDCASVTSRTLPSGDMCVRAGMDQSNTVEIKPFSPGNSSLVCRETAAVAGSSSHTSTCKLSRSVVTSSPTLNPSSKPDPPKQAVSSPHKRSQFTWVKSQKTEETSSQTHPHHSSSLLSTAPSPSELATAKRVPVSIRKVPRRTSLSSGAAKTSSKYTWVSTSTAAKAGSSPKILQKPLSPKALKASPKSPHEGVDMSKKSKPTAQPPSKTTASKPRVNHSSRYCWKATGQNQTASGPGLTPGSKEKQSIYQWTSEKKNGPKGLKVLSRSSSSPSQVRQSTSVLTVSPGGFKLRSRMKIIRRTSCSSGSERRSSPSPVVLKSQYSLNRRAHTPARSFVGVRRVQSRTLVSFGRHKLRRVSSVALQGQTRAGPSSSVSVRGPATQRVIKTRYKIDTRRGNNTAAHTHNPALSYRVKRLQSARMLLQNRLRAPSDRQWKGRGMRWIGGALYQVSANKLSRTHTASTPSSKTGKWLCPQEVVSSTASRSSNTRHVASRVVQRSLVIVRQARLKRQQKAKQYCMYYNRFGKCNHGDNCPYIHDPDKVAVCTRFLRGTCKQTDGTCPFSHKVSKEKMPVCSYFLKGICNNSSCPYSHVYVSRKAAVCQDFIRGYCPQGEKCKKKHTLLCPDFSSSGLCPRGSKCKLRHRQRVKRTSPCVEPNSAKRERHGEGPQTAEDKRCETVEDPDSSQADNRTGLSGPARLPSFISLSSSPDRPQSEHTQETTTHPPASSPPATVAPESTSTGKKLHIKPRF
ncbi:zinc finger CCCH domain-containing protein 3 [Chanos chanos]|uniref:Zinc finger CCCH domain-containing protein 3 n=1 Tax=Chanos chanos TaxID=29144 RepID=A0A6J2WN63_CHACN|nr:zinc finger CCCH domain-containing protein 3 [Chanos chanos]